MKDFRLGKNMKKVKAIAGIFLACVMVLPTIGCGEGVTIHLEGNGIANQNSKDVLTAADLGHTEDHYTEEFPPSYIECKGGYTEPYVCCYDCSLLFNMDGEMMEWVDGTGVHTPSDEMYPANYIECMGGHQEDYYICILCNEAINADGDVVPWTEGTYQHVPVEHDFTALDPKCTWSSYTDYVCELCGVYCNEDGSSAEEREPTEPHMIDEEIGLIEADYTECNGGVTVDYYVCKNCYTFIDENGNELMDCIENGTGIHSVTNTNSALHLAVALICAGEQAEVTKLYECEMCGQLVDENGVLAQWDYYDLGGHEPDYDVQVSMETYAEENPGKSITYPYIHPCKNCGWPISPDGTIAIININEDEAGAN